MKIVCSKRDAIACSTMELAIYMLEGGNIRVQQLMYEQLLHVPTAIEAVHMRIQRAMAATKMQHTSAKAHIQRRFSKSAFDSKGSLGSIDDDVLYYLLHVPV